MRSLKEQLSIPWLSGNIPVKMAVFSEAFCKADEIHLALCKIASSSSMLSGGLLRLERDKQDFLLLMSLTS